MAAPEQPGPEQAGPEPGSGPVTAHRPPPGPDGSLVQIDRWGGDVTVICMSGEIDLDSVPGVERAVLAAVQAPAGHRIVVELNRVRLFAACGLALLVTAHEQAARRGGEVVLVVDEAAPAARTLGCVPDIGVPVFGTMTAALAGRHPEPAADPAEAGTRRSTAHRDDRDPRR